MENTKIEWSHHTFNPWRGCTKVADGCTNCYADTLSKRNPSTLGIWGPNGTRVMAAPAAWREPIKWNKAAEKAGERHRVFCASLADVFEDWGAPIVNSRGEQLFCCAHCGERWAGPPYNDPLKRIFCKRDNCSGHGLDLLMTMADVRRDLFALIDATPHLDWLLLTKRPENIRRMWPSYESDKLIGERDYRPGRLGGLRMDNVWLLTSIATQADADRNIPELLKCRDLVPVLGVSAEPLIEAVEFSDVTHRSDCVAALGKPAMDGLDWIIVGGESGHNARPFDIAWARSIVKQCAAAGVPCFVKQLGAVPFEDDSAITGAPIDRAKLTRLPGAAMKDPKGGDWSEWPKDLRVREFPQSAVVNG